MGGGDNQIIIFNHYRVSNIIYFSAIFEVVDLSNLLSEGVKCEDIPVLSVILVIIPQHC